MLYKSGRQRIFMIISAFFLLLVGMISCTANVTPLAEGPAKNQTATTGAATPDSLLDIRSFQAQPKTIKAGETTTLAWNVAGASTMSIEPVIGLVSGNIGSVSIAPKETTLYTLKVSDGLLQTSVKFLVIVKNADGSIIWPNSSSDKATAEQLYEGWIYYPNKYVEWTFEDNHPDAYSDIGSCWHFGYITNNHREWMMTDITVGAADAQIKAVTNSNIEAMTNTVTAQSRVVVAFILPGWRISYATSMDCQLQPELKWKWRIYK
jgi:hypothetical protein